MDIDLLQSLRASQFQANSIVAFLRSSWSCEMASFESDDESENIWKESLPILYVDCHGGFSSVEDSVTSLSTIERAEEGLQDSLRQSRLQRALAPGQILTQSDIQRLYDEQGLGPLGVPVIFILKLSLAMISFGQSAADTEDVVFQVCTAIELPVVHFEVGTRNIHASFGGIVHTVPFARGINADKLASTISLANLMMMRVGSVQGASDLLDDILNCVLLIVFVSTTFPSVPWASLRHLQPSWEAGVMLQQSPSFYHWLCLHRSSADASARNGLIWKHSLWRWWWVYRTPLVSKILKAEMCEVPAIYLSPLLVYLPGSQLIYGAYEIQFGSLVNGVSQLGSCVVRCMFLAMALLIGWQFFGHGFYDGETVSSMLLPRWFLWKCHACFHIPGRWYFSIGMFHFYL